MANILVISKNDNILKETLHLFSLHGFFNTPYFYDNDENAINFIKENNFDTILIDDEINSYPILVRQIKNIDLEKNIFTALLYTPEKIAATDEDFTGFIDAFFQKPLQKNILIPTINSCLKVQKNIEKFRQDNKELNKSLYQLDVLYNTSFMLSGNLDKEKLYEIMFEALEKTLSFDMACALIHTNNSKKNEDKLIIHSLKKPDITLLDAIKQQIISLSKENNTQNSQKDFSNLITEEYIKPSYDNQKYDIKFLNSDKLTAPISVKDENFGTLLIYRNKPFQKEDVVCFQSIVHQVSSPLRAITLYNEIKNTNMELKKLERIKSEFVSIVSHELRTPLTPINNSLDIVLSENISDAAKNFTNMAKRNVARLSHMIEDLLDLSRIETGKFVFKYNKYNIKTSFDFLLKTFKDQAQNKNIDFKISLEDSLPDIYADSGKIEQILTNLTANALKFTPNDGSVEIHAKTISINDVDKNSFISPINSIISDKDNKYINISIKDTGIGIKEEDIPKIFDKFSQIENSLTRNAGGIGLGLTITKHFVDAHLGAIWVESKENNGSDFNVIIPVFSESKAFETDLAAAKKINNSTHLLTIKSYNETKCINLISRLKNENIIKTLKNSKEISFQDNKTYTYKTYFSNMQKSAFDFMTNQIEKLINSPEYTACGIVLEKAVFNKEQDDDYSI